MEEGCDSVWNAEALKSAGLSFVLSLVDCAKFSEDDDGKLVVLTEI